MRTEVRCTNTECDSCVPNAFGEGKHFWHIQLVEGEYNYRARCPQCGSDAQPMRVVTENSRFALGKIVFTSGVVALVMQDREFKPGAEDEVRRLLTRHASGDWGDLDDEDKVQNDRSIRYDLRPGHVLDRTRVLSAYQLLGEKVWIITEAGRHETTVLFPDEY